MLDLVIPNVPDRVRVLGFLSPKESDVFTDHGTVSFQFHASTKATHKIKRTVYDYRNGDFAGLRGALEALNLCNLIRDSDDINLDWTYWKDAFMSAVSDFIPTEKIKGKNTPPWITSEIIHALRKKEAARSKLRNLLQTIKDRSIANCVQRPRFLYARAVRFTSAHLTQISRGSLNAFGPFSSSRIKRGPSLKR